MYLKIPFQTEQNIDLSKDLTQLELLIIKMLCKENGYSNSQKFIVEECATICKYLVAFEYFFVVLV